MITFEQADEMFEYSPDTGEIKYKINASVRHLTKGKVATFEHKAGNNYTRLKVQYKKVHYQAHRIAWLLFYREHPEGIIDHINGNPLDNRISNLRIVSSRQNQLNRVKGTSIYKNNKYGIAGLYYVKVKNVYKWRAKSFADGKAIHLGYFDNKFDACCEIIKKKAG